MRRMRVVRRPGVVVAAPLTALVLLLAPTGCADETETYCGELRDQQAVLEDLAERSGEGEDTLDETVEVLRGLQERAPGDIADEWTTVLFAYEGLVDAFRAAGVEPGGYDPEDPPAGVSRREADRIRDAAAELTSARVLGAANALEQHARDVCDVDLGLGGGG